MSYFTKRYHPPGTSPGTLVMPDGEDKMPSKFILVDYTDESLTEKQFDSIAECIPYLQQPTVTWIHVEGTPDAESLRELGGLFNLHALSLEDVLNSGQRPKVDIIDEDLFVVMSLPVINDNKVTTEQVSLFVGKNYLLSFHSGAVDPFKLIRKRIQLHSGKIRSRQADYLMYSLIDAIIDEGFPVLEQFGDYIELLEEELLDNPDKTTLRKLHELKRELLLLRRMLWPQRDVLNLMIRDEPSIVDQDTFIYLRDCYDHTIQIMDLV